MTRIKHVISISGGKDSLATGLIARENCPRESLVYIFCDTGNEHQAVYGYLDYLEQVLDIEIVRLKADFTEQIARKRMFIARDQRGGRKYQKVLKTDLYGNPEYLKNKVIRVIHCKFHMVGSMFSFPQWNRMRMR